MLPHFRSCPNSRSILFFALLHSLVVQQAIVLKIPLLFALEAGGFFFRVFGITNSIFGLLGECFLEALRPPRCSLINLVNPFPNIATTFSSSEMLLQHASRKGLLLGLNNLVNISGFHLHLVYHQAPNKLINVHFNSFQFWMAVILNSKDLGSTLKIFLTNLSCGMSFLSALELYATLSVASISFTFSHYHRMSS